MAGTIGYYNGEAAFLLVPFWAAVYVAGSRRTNPILRGMVLGGAVLCAEAAVLSQSRGAMVAMALSLPVFFLFSGQRLRGLLALAPIVVALTLTFPDLNEVYLESLNQGDPVAALRQALPLVWMTSGGAGLYGLLWGSVDRWWSPPRLLVRGVGGMVLVGLLVGLVIVSTALHERVGNPVTWGEQRWEAFKNDDSVGQGRSRYLSASGSGRYVLWQVAWRDFVDHPFLGVGTHNYEATYYKLREKDVGWVRQPHMLPLEVLSERGVAGGILFAGFLSTCLLAGLFQRFKGLNPEQKAQVGALIAGVAYWFVHSSAEWFWQIPAITLPAIVYLALLAAPWRRAESAPLRWSTRAGIAVVSLLAMAAIAPLYVADRYLEASYVATDPIKALKLAESAQRFNPVDPRIPRQEAEIAARIGDNARAKRAYRKTIDLNPEHFAPYALFAEYYQVRGHRSQALALYKESQERNPLDKDISEVVRVLGRPEPR